MSRLPDSEPTSYSPKRIVPAVGLNMAPRQVSSVVLPQPDGPSNNVSEPGSTASENPSMGRDE